MSPLYRGVLLVLSFLIVSWGQPIHQEWLALAASSFGYALFWRVMLDIPSKAERFIKAMGWYTGVTIVQLTWLLSHPYAYIYAVILCTGWLNGAQFGLLTLFVTRDNCRRLIPILGMSALWVLLEWSRLFVLSGLSFNPSGLALSANLYSLQFASIGGIYFLSFWVILVNLCVLRGWCTGQWVLPLITFAVPFIYGLGQVTLHSKAMQEHGGSMSVLLVQPAFPVIDAVQPQTAEEARVSVLNKWRTILQTIEEYKNKTIEMIVMPEYVVPYGTYHPVFPLVAAKQLLKQTLGHQVEKLFPPLQEPMTAVINGIPLASNAYFVQTIANFLKVPTVIGLEDSVYVDETQTKAESFSSAFHFFPDTPESIRYDKRILVPMGEYIPFEFCRAMAARYGIGGSFTPGKEAKVCNGVVPIGTTICYEETFGHLMRENRLKGAEFLINLTNDGWYPDSSLPRQHFDHSRLRTVENGVALARACNTGLTGAFDSLGRIVATLGNGDAASQKTSGALLVSVPTYHYHTIYTQWGDYFILITSLLLIIWWMYNEKRNLWSSR